MEVDGEAEQAFDLEPYAGNFSGHGKVARLLFIARTAQSAQLRLEALRMAADELKTGQDTAKYEEVMKAIAGRLGPTYEVDGQWVAATDAAAARRQAELEAELAGYKTNLIKESIRLGHNDLGNHHYARGSLQEALKSYVRARDYCTTNAHHWATSLHAARIAIEMGSLPHVLNHVAKAEQQPDLKGHPEVVAKLAAASGLALLDAKRYKAAAKKFTEVGAELGAGWNSVVSPQEVALFGGLCGLAALDRCELKAHLINNVPFREYLETYPEVRELVSDFYGSRYAATLAQLARLQPALCLDLHLHRHAAELLAMVRSKALVQYTSPFVSVHLPTMAAAFSTDAQVLEAEIAELIQGGHTQARIDSGSQVLYKRRADVRAGVFAAAMQSAEEYMRETRAALVRASLQRHELVQRAPPGARGGKGGGSHASFLPGGSGAWGGMLDAAEAYRAQLGRLD